MDAARRSTRRGVEAHSPSSSPSPRAPPPRRPTHAAAAAEAARGAPFAPSSSTDEDATPLTAGRLLDGAGDAATEELDEPRAASASAAGCDVNGQQIGGGDHGVGGPRGRRLDARARRGVCDQHAQPVPDHRGRLAAAARRHRARAATRRRARRSSSTSRRWRASSTGHKTANHPHTNMAKAALNMMTRNVGARAGVDGWRHDRRRSTPAGSTTRTHAPRRRDDVLAADSKIDARYANASSRTLGGSARVGRVQKIRGLRRIGGGGRRRRRPRSGRRRQRRLDESELWRDGTSCERAASSTSEPSVRASQLLRAAEPRSAGGSSTTTRRRATCTSSWRPTAATSRGRTRRSSRTSATRRS